MNKCIFLGRLTNDIELKNTAGDKVYTKFNLAVTRRGDGVDFIQCTAWGRTAELMKQYLTKGNQICIAGRLQTGYYDDKDGKRVYTTDVIVEEVDFTGRKKDIEAKAGDKITDDDLPF